VLLATIILYCHHFSGLSSRNYQTTTVVVVVG
jgi:hypothetical protein